MEARIGPFKRADMRGRGTVYLAGVSFTDANIGTAGRSGTLVYRQRSRSEDDGWGQYLGHQV